MAKHKKTYRGDQKLRGLMPVLPTPVLEDETLDEEGLERLVEFTLKFPFCGVWALATASEDENLPLATRKAFTRSLVHHFGGKLPLLIKTSEPGTRETIERTREFADLGIDIAVVHPQHKMLSEDHYLRALEAIADASPVPVYLYHNGMRGAELATSTLIRLSHHQNIAGIKAGGSNLSKLQYLALFSNPDFSVFTAGAGQTLACLAMGVDGHMAIPFSAFPEIGFHILQAFEKGDHPSALHWQRVMIEWVTALPALQNREINGEIKALLEVRGIIGRHVTSPFVAATDEHIEKIRDYLQEHPFPEFNRE